MHTRSRGNAHLWRWIATLVWGPEGGMQQGASTANGQHAHVTRVPNHPQFSHQAQQLRRFGSPPPPPSFHAGPQKPLPPPLDRKFAYT
jgi:hypothetical protein